MDGWMDGIVLKIFSVMFGKSTVLSVLCSPRYFDSVLLPLKIIHVYRETNK